MSRQELAMASNNIEYHQSIAAFPGRKAVTKCLDSTVFKNGCSTEGFSMGLGVLRCGYGFCVLRGRKRRRAMDDHWLGDPVLWDIGHWRNGYSISS